MLFFQFLNLDYYFIKKFYYDHPLVQRMLGHPDFTNPPVILLQYHQKQDE